MLRGAKIVITAGPTREAIDPVRYISNHSTGKMGYAIAGVLAERGAEVTLITGPTALATPPGVHRVDVESAAQMLQASCEAFQSATAAIFCAAVADYTPCTVHPEKIKKELGPTEAQGAQGAQGAQEGQEGQEGQGGKGSQTMTLELKKTVDIAAHLSAQKEHRITVGFALETENERVHAEQKLTRKNLDFIILNSMREAGAGFGGDTNKVTIIDHKGSQELPLMQKREVAQRIADKLEEQLCCRG